MTQSPTQPKTKMSDDILTDELIEKGARALCHARGDVNCIVNGCTPEKCMWPWEYTNPARACLTAALPMILEECAKIALAANRIKARISQLDPTKEK